MTVDEIKQERSASPTEEALEADLNMVKCEEETNIRLEAADMQTLVKEELSWGDDRIKINRKSDCRPTSDDEDELCENITEKTAKLQLERHKKEKQDAEIRRFFTMKCDICSDVQFDTLKKVRKHYRQVHKTKGYLICCGNKYGKRCGMLDHIQYNVNPDAHRCDQCGKNYRNRKILREHMKCHVRAHKCNICSSSFPSAAILKNHVRDTHSTDTSEKFPCDQCDKICRTKTLLISHIRNVHDPTMDHICEVCGRSFKQKVNLQNHKKFKHSTTPVPKVQCDICGIWLKHARPLRQHLRMHQEMLEAQKGNLLNCSICKKKVQTKRLLANHIRNSHGERKHQCTFCDKAFRTPTILKEHVALHTGIDLYSCPYCDRTFKSNANMYSHRKKAHLEEWSKDKAEKDRCKQAAPNETVTTAKTVIV